jgi:uncharacterized damage-inducible protein DinB
MESEIKRITALLQQTFTKEAWHGPSVLEALAKVTPALASARASANTHSIIELVAHMRAWRIAVIEWLSGNTTYIVTDALNFPTITDWPAAVAALRESQEKLIATITAFPEERLNELVPQAPEPCKWYNLLHGIIHHDTYHTGQISLITKAIATATAA